MVRFRVRNKRNRAGRCPAQCWRGAATPHLGSPSQGTRATAQHSGEQALRCPVWARRLGDSQGERNGAPRRGENTDPSFGKCISHGQFLNPGPPPPMLFNICTTDRSSLLPQSTAWNVLLSSSFKPLPTQLRGHFLPEAARDVPRQGNHALILVPRALFKLRSPRRTSPHRQAPPTLQVRRLEMGVKCRFWGGSEVLLF